MVYAIGQRELLKEMPYYTREELYKLARCLNLGTNSRKLEADIDNAITRNSGFEVTGNVIKVVQTKSTTQRLPEKYIQDMTINGFSFNAKGIMGNPAQLNCAIYNFLKKNKWLREAKIQELAAHFVPGQESSFWQIFVANKKIAYFQLPSRSPAWRRMHWE